MRVDEVWSPRHAGAPGVRAMRGAQPGQAAVIARAARALGVTSRAQSPPARGPRGAAALLALAASRARCHAPRPAAAGGVRRVRAAAECPETGARGRPGWCSRGQGRRGRLGGRRHGAGVPARGRRGGCCPPIPLTRWRRLDADGRRCRDRGGAPGRAPTRAESDAPGRKPRAVSGTARGDELFSGLSALAAAGRTTTGGDARTGSARRRPASPVFAMGALSRPRRRGPRARRAYVWLVDTAHTGHALRCRAAGGQGLAG